MLPFAAGVFSPLPPKRDKSPLAAALGPSARPEAATLTPGKTSEHDYCVITSCDLLLRLATLRVRNGIANLNG